MDKEKLEAYRSMKAEIAELEEKLKNQAHEPAMYGNSVILNYNSGYPVPQAVVGIDLGRYGKQFYKRVELQKELEQICMEVENFIESIPDSETRRIFRMRYIDGEKLSEIGKILRRDRSVVSRKIDNYLRQQA